MLMCECACVKYLRAVEEDASGCLGDGGGGLAVGCEEDVRGALTMMKS